MKFVKFILIYSLISYNAGLVVATVDANQPSQNSTDKVKASPVIPKIEDEYEYEKNPDYEKIVDEYKKYLISVPNSVKEEIHEFRVAIAEINKAKKDLYQKLTQQGQAYLKKEQEYKKKLPLKLRRKLGKTGGKEGELGPKRKTKKNSKSESEVRKN